MPGRTLPRCWPDVRQSQEQQVEREPGIHIGLQVCERLLHSCLRSLRIGRTNLRRDCADGCLVVRARMGCPVRQAYLHQQDIPPP